MMAQYDDMLYYVAKALWISTRDPAHITIMMWSLFESHRARTLSQRGVAE